MSFRLGTDLNAIGQLRTLSNNVDHYDKTIQQLASGRRIVEAADDAAGLAISENMKKSIRSMQQAIKNTNDGISLIQVAEGALSSVSDILIRFKELAVQAASDTISDLNRDMINKEVIELKQAIDQVAYRTEFNGAKLLNGEDRTLDIQIGINHKDHDRMTLKTADLACRLEDLGLVDFDLSDKISAQEGLGKVHGAILRVNKTRSTFGALQNRLQKSASELSSSLVGTEEAKSRILDTDFADKTSILSIDNIKSMAGVEALKQTNMRNGLVLNLIK